MNFYKKLLHIILVSLVPTILFSTSVDAYIDTSKCDQIIDKQLYQICYSYKYKGALSGWVQLDGTLVGKGDIKKRARFYNEKIIPMKYRTKYKDYTGYGKDWNRGHFVVADADFDYDAKALNKAYTMANIIPQAANVNQKTWIKVERYGRSLAQKFGYINSISIAKYDDLSNKMDNDIVIPTKLYRIYYNNENKFEKCFEYENRLDVDYKNDKLKNHEIDCQTLRVK
jgi:endonuclease G